MILVDSSVWIDYFNGATSAAAAALDRLMDSGRLLIGDLILAEVLQGLRSEFDAARALRRFNAFELHPLGGREVAVAAARNYRLLRGRGITVRGTIDALIATFCIVKGHQLLHADRDFDPFARHLGLRVIKV